MIDPMSPREAVNQYLEELREESAKTTHENHMYRLERFLEWSDENDLDNMNDISGKKLMMFKKERQRDLAKITLKNQLGTLRQFLEFCEDINVAPNGVSRRLRLPTVDIEDEVSDVYITTEEAEKILEYCNKYEYATRRHVTFHILWQTGMRSGAIRGLDIDDFDKEGQTISINHRPESGTPLKNKERGARYVHIDTELTELITDFLNMHHPHVEDENGRMPLVGTQSGRMHKTSLQRNIYTLTRPCHYTNECPHDREIDDCEATSYNTASKCPSSVSPHALRKGAVTAHRKGDVPKDVVGERMDMSGQVLDKHYDKRTKKEKMETRKKYLDSL